MFNFDRFIALFEDFSGISFSFLNKEEFISGFILFDNILAFLEFFDLEGIADLAQFVGFNSGEDLNRFQEVLILFSFLTKLGGKLIKLGKKLIKKLNVTYIAASLTILLKVSLSRDQRIQSSLAMMEAARGAL